MTYAQIAAIVGVIVWMVVSYRMWIEVFDKDVGLGVILASLALGAAFGAVLGIVVVLLGILVGAALGVIP